MSLFVSTTKPQPQQEDGSPNSPRVTPNASAMKVSKSDTNIHLLLNRGHDPNQGHDSKRNISLASDRRDNLVDWMLDMLYHSFVLNAKGSYVGTMLYFEELILEYREKRKTSRLFQYVPNLAPFFTPLPLSRAFEVYDDKYSISSRNFVAPSFNEMRHILNLAQIMAIGKTLKLISFDGDQTLYSDGGNFEDNEELAAAIIQLLICGVKVALITAAGYGLDGSKYEKRLQGLFDRFITYRLSKEQVENFYVFGGECNYLMQCTLLPVKKGKGVRGDSMIDVYSGAVIGSPEMKGSTNTEKLEGEEEEEEEEESNEDIENRVMNAKLIPVPVEAWQADHLDCPKPFYWDQKQVDLLLDVAEKSMRATVSELNLRAKVLRKDRAVGVYPGGDEMLEVVPKGHGSKKLKKEALEELVLRVMDSLRDQQNPSIELPYCVFNGGRDAWLDVGNKSIAIKALQAYHSFPPETCLHVGDQFLNTGNDLAARFASPCIWIHNPHETGKVLQHVLKHLERLPRVDSTHTYY